LYSLYSCSSLYRNLTPLYFLDTEHATQKTQPVYCCRGMLPRSCLANSLGADHIENTFHSCCVLLYPRLYWCYTQLWMSFIVAYFCTHYPAMGCLPRICFRGVFTDPLSSSGPIRHSMIGMFCFAKPVLAEDLYIVQREEFSVTFYTCDTYT
jgi:hypothetical protein